MTFDQLIDLLKQKAPKIVPIGLSDKDGMPINTGDIVKFYVTPDTGVSVPFGPRPGVCKMVDVVLQIDRVFYFVNLISDTGARAWRHNQSCKVIGNIYDSPEALKEGLRFQPEE